MPQIRFSALGEAQKRMPQDVELPYSRVSEIFGEHTFNVRSMEISNIKSIKDAG